MTSLSGRRDRVGTVAAQRFTWQGTVNGEPVITVRTNWMMDDGHLSDGWKLGEQRFECEIDGDGPPLLVTFHGLHPPVLGQDSWIGLIAAAMHCVNAIPYVVRGRARHQDLPRPPLDRGARRGSVAQRSALIFLLAIERMFV